MLKLRRTPQFDSDLQRVLRAGKDRDLLTDVVTILLEERDLPEEYRDHALHGEWAGVRATASPHKRASA